MAVAESIKFLAGTWFFLRGFIKAFIAYLQDAEAKFPKNAQIQGEGMQERLPEQLPSIIEIKRALPKHCFQPKVSTSMYYALKDFALVAVTYAVFVQVEQLPWVPIQIVATVLYWGVQGTFFTAIFVIGHDCGHGSFSRHVWLNDLVGQIWHGFIMAPYYMWKLSHSKHHKFNANFEKDEVFYPVKESWFPKKRPEDPATPFLPGFGLGLGWFAYLVFGYSPRNVNHFNLRDPMFRGHVMGCLVTVAVMLSWSYCLYLYAAAFGSWALISHYVVPVFVFACYMVVITFLHHNEVNIPWYADSEWDFVRGQLSTIDRHYGYVHDVIHNIGTHQMHHMFIKIPHYHLEEATKHFRTSFPHLVRHCSEPIMPAFWRMCVKYGKQSVIKDDTKVHYYE